MNNFVEYKKIDAQLYPDYLGLCQTNKYGSLMLPPLYQDNLWGCLIIVNSMVVGGWVGVYRGNGRLSQLIAKSVYFDNAPIFASNAVRHAYENDFMQFVKELARQEKIVQLNYTHWLRENCPDVDDVNIGATFMISLPQSEEELWKGVDSKQRNIIRKGEKSGVEVIVCKGQEALGYLDDFQALRQITQSRAISQNQNASMLLKSNNFFEELFLRENTTLFVGRVGEKVASVALMLQGGKTVYYYSGGSDRELNRQTGCSAYVIWKAILYYNELGTVDVFDMGGVPVNPTKEHPAYGVYSFKKSFGGIYQEFKGGKYIICKWKYRMLNRLLHWRFLLRILSKKGL